MKELQIQKVCPGQLYRPQSKDDTSQKPKMPFLCRIILNKTATDLVHKRSKIITYNRTSWADIRLLGSLLSVFPIRSFAFAEMFGHGSDSKFIFPFRICLKIPLSFSANRNFEQGKETNNGKLKDETSCWLHEEGESKSSPAQNGGTPHNNM